MGRPLLNFGHRLRSESYSIAADSAVTSTLALLKTGDVVRISPEQSATVPGMAPVPFQRQASTYGYPEIPRPCASASLLVVRTYSSTISIDSDDKRTFEMLLLVPLIAEPGEVQRGDAILTWLVDRTGWIRCAEDYSRIDMISGIEIIGGLAVGDALLTRLLDASVDADEQENGCIACTVSQEGSAIVPMYSNVFVPFA
jgi:hypothetical protein